MFSKIVKKQIPDFIFITLLLFALFNQFDFFKKVKKILENEYETRLINSYSYCGNESIGFLNFIKKKYQPKKNIKILNNFISPDPSWFMKISENNEYNENLIIVLGDAIRNIYFVTEKDYFISKKTLKNLNNIEELSFDIDGIDSLKKLNGRIEIYEKGYQGDIQQVYEQNFIFKPRNVFNLQYKIEQKISNSKLIVKFLQDNNKFLEVKNLKVAFNSQIGTENYKILEKYQNCYLFSKKM